MTVERDYYPMPSFPTLSTSNLEASRRFYVDGLGFHHVFSIPGPDGEEKAVLVIQCRLNDMMKRANLMERLHGLVRQELGIDCFIELVPRHTLPRTSSRALPIFSSLLP